MMQQNSRQRLQCMMRPGSKLLLGFEQQLQDTRMAKNEQQHEERKTTTGNATIMSITENMTPMDTKTKKLTVLDQQQVAQFQQEYSGSGGF